jgi:hypothetical protein
VPFNSFLIDRARRVFEEQQPTGASEWVEGEPRFSDTPKHGPWFRARLTVREPREDAPQGRGYRYLEGDAELMLGTRDLEGGYLADPDGRFVGFDADDRVEVITKGGELSELWLVNTGAEPIRKVRGRLLGFKVGLNRVRDVTVERGG